MTKFLTRRSVPSVREGFPEQNNTGTGEIHLMASGEGVSIARMSIQRIIRNKKERGSVVMSTEVILYGIGLLWITILVMGFNIIDAIDKIKKDTIFFDVNEKEDDEISDEEEPLTLQDFFEARLSKN